jgi:hypothetical protein
MKSPIFKSVTKSALGCIPVVGPTLGKMAGPALDMANGALDKAKGGNRKTRRAIQQSTKAAKAGNPKAMRQNAALVAAAKLRNKPPKVKRAAKGLLGAGKLVQRARFGDLTAQGRLRGIMNQAQQGDRAAIAAAGYVNAAMRGLANPPEEEDFDREDGYEDEGSESESWDPSMSEDADIADEAVGALAKARKTPNRAYVVRELNRLRVQRPGYRRPSTSRKAA